MLITALLAVHVAGVSAQSLAIATDDGLVAPILKDCDSKSLAELSAACQRLIERAKASNPDALPPLRDEFKRTAELVKEAVETSPGASMSSGHDVDCNRCGAWAVFSVATKIPGPWDEVLPVTK